MLLAKRFFTPAIIAVYLSLVAGTGNAEERETTQWSFESEESSNLVFHGNVVRDQEGPRPPEYPDFTSTNQAVRLEQRGASISIQDPGEGSPFDFTNGDDITLEAWVNPSIPGNGSPMVIVGKGRHGNSKFATDNQNWAMRLVGNQGEYKLNFLFSSGVRSPGPADQHWHRWTSTVSFVQNTGWHHIAVSYSFGKPDSIRGWIDGVPTSGQWDMGGPTTLPPVVDDDEVRISSVAQANQFVGLIDQVAIHRKLMDDKAIASRFNRLGGPRTATLAPEVAPVLGDLPANKVQVTLHESMPKLDRWYYQGEAEPPVSVQWDSTHLFLSRIPTKFDDWGIRDDWKAPTLLRLACDVAIPQGKHKVWLRVRGLGRLWANGEVIARSEPVTRVVRDGEQLVSPVPLPPKPGYRAAGYHQQEIMTDWIVKAEGGQPGEQVNHRMILETIVGGPSRRTETGEILVAIQLEGSDEIQLLGATRQKSILLQDQQVQPLVEKCLQDIEQLETSNRRKASQAQDLYWRNRHEFAAQSLKADGALPLPAPKDFTTFSTRSTNPIDGFVNLKKQRVWDQSKSGDQKSAELFHSRVLPILRENCFRCHGDKANGGLRLDQYASLFLPADSGLAAIVPERPDESELIAQVKSGAMPPTDKKLSSDEIATLEQWIIEGAGWPPKPLSAEFATAVPSIDDAAFLRRIYLDTIGIPPNELELTSFLKDNSAEKRAQAVEGLLRDVRVADNWMGFWQDLLAENPTLINQSIGSTGPFRWYLLDALRDRKSVDRMVTELTLMRGSTQSGGTAAFGLAGETDSPMAAKGGILASAFLGVETQCARCHDSPYHSSKQEDLYSLAAMLDRKAVQVPATSQVPAAFFERKGRESLIRVTLQPDASISPKWPFEEFHGSAFLGEPASPGDPSNSEGTIRGDDQRWLANPNDTREQLAYLLTSPNNKRFPQVFVNRLWKRLIGAGIVEPVDDWEGKSASHPELLEWLSHEFVASGYDWRKIVQLILTSELYAKQAIGENAKASPEERFFHAPDTRRLTAEQVVDSLHSALGKPFDSEELTFVHDGQRTLGQRQTLGVPYRSWMFTSLNNERDRPSLALPRAAAIVDVLESFGWTGSRQRPISHRDEEPNVLQPGILANGAMVQNLVRVTYGSTASSIAMDASSPEALVQTWFLRIAGRPPEPKELQEFSAILADGFSDRISELNAPPPDPNPELPQVTWFNHLRPETTTIQMEHERRVQEGPKPDPRLASSWRERYEDFLWTLVNDPNFVWYP